MKCSKCGTDNPKDKSVCKKCGAFLYSTNPNNRVPLTAGQKRDRRKAILKGSAKGCIWSVLVVIGMFIVLGILSYLLVRFVIPEDFFTGSTTTSITESISASASQTT